MTRKYIKRERNKLKKNLNFIVVVKSIYLKGGKCGCRFKFRIENKVFQAR